MSTSFGYPLNNVSVLLASNHVSGDGQFVLAAGSSTLFGNLPASRFYRVTAVLDPGTPSETIIGIYTATGITINTLTGVAASEGFTDVSIAAGATISVRATAGSFSELQTAINTLESSVVYSGGVSGGQTVTGGTGNTQSLTLQSTSGTKGNIIFGTSVYNDFSNSLGIRRSNPQGALDVLMDVNGAFFDRYGGTVNINLQRANGTVSAPTTVSDMNNISIVRVQGYDGTQFTTGGELGFFAQGTISTGIVPTAMHYSSQPSTGGAVVERFLVHGTGRVGINVAGNAPAAQLEVDTMAASLSALMLEGFASQSAKLLRMAQLSSTLATQDIGYIDGNFSNPDNLAYTGYLALFSNDINGPREVIRIDSNGTAGLLSFFAQTPAVRVTGGSATAGATYGANEQAMLQKVYNMARTYGLMT